MLAIHGVWSISGAKELDVPLLRSIGSYPVLPCRDPNLTAISVHLRVFCYRA